MHASDVWEDGKWGWEKNKRAKKGGRISANVFKERRPLREDIQFECNLGWQALCEFIDRDVIFRACAFIMRLEGHVFTDFLDDGGAEDVEAKTSVPRRIRAVVM